MAKKKKKIWVPLVILLFILYIFLAAQPLPQELVLKSRWISSTEDPAQTGNARGPLIPFKLGNRFGYIDNSGIFSLNKNREHYISLSPFRWAEFELIPEKIEVKSPLDETEFTLTEPAGYPFFMDNRNFIIGKEQNSISALDDTGEILWTYDFNAPITCIDAKAGLLFAGLLDGTVELLNAGGKSIFSFETMGSRISIVYGCAISGDGSKLAVISGIDEQRFLLFDQHGGSYKVAYHEYIGEGFRRPVFITFIDKGRRVVFERKGGIGIFDTLGRQSSGVAIDGDISAIDTNGDNDLFFVVTSVSEKLKNLVIIRYPGTIIGKAPFKTEESFLRRENSALIIGGGNTLISFELEKR